MREGTVLVFGATGHQGGATARALLAAGWPVRAFVRDRQSPAAHDLAAVGAELVVGDLDVADSISRALAGVYGVFSVQPLAESETELTAESLRGRRIVELADRAGVQHLVYSSVGGAERHTGIDHFESKAEIEKRVLDAKCATTILRPTFFMDNLLGFLPASNIRTLRLPVDPQRPMQMIATADIGRIAAVTFDAPDLYADRQLELAGDELTFDAVASVFGRLTGTSTRLEPQPIEDPMFAWFIESGYQADLQTLRTTFPWLLRFDQFLKLHLSVPAGRGGAAA